MKKLIHIITLLICLIALNTSISGSSDYSITNEYSKKSVFSEENSLQNIEDADIYEGLEELLQPVFVEIDENSLEDEEVISTDKKYSYSSVEYLWKDYSSDYYYNKMSTNKQILYDELDELCMNYLLSNTNVTNDQTYIDSGVTIRITDYISCADLNLTKSEIEEVLLIFNYSNPQYYFIAHYYVASTNYAALSVYDIFSNGVSRTVYTEEFKSQITDWENDPEVSSASTVYEKELAIHDVICENVSYDTDNPENPYYQSSVSAVLSYGEFTNKTVCAGYAKTFELLCNSAGIETINVTSSSHAWNKVRLYNKWYNVDLTWNDQPSGYNYYYFNKSDANILDSSHTTLNFWNTYLPISSSDFNPLTDIISNYVEIPELTSITVVGGKKVTLTHPQDGSLIYYTTDGSTPQAIESKRYTGAFTLSSTATVKAIAIYNGYTSSESLTEVVVTKTTTPSIASSDVSSGKSISISCSMPGVTIYYTTDGSVPSISSNKYTSSFTLVSNANVKAIAVKRGYANSEVANLNVIMNEYLNGVYVISTALNSSKVIDVTSASKSVGANIQLYSSNGSNAQRFYICRLSNGNYTIININSGQALDVVGGGTAVGTNVWQYTYNRSLAQQWIMESSGDGYYYMKSAVNGLYLDVSGANTANGTNIQVWTGNKSKAQKFAFKLIASQTISNGIYKISSALNSTKMLDIAGGSALDGANLQIYSSNGTKAQLFQVTYLNNGYYSITSIASNKVLDVKGAGTTIGTNVWQYTANGSAAQQWIVKINTDGTYSLISKCSGLYLDVSGGSSSDGTNVQTWTGNGSKAQKFNLIKN